ncbi:hypothetical protein F5Y14DRAFT_136025 [Nemania sp. NC0429]|nr:hypothetical protein F5Y14DRAFT_136025 [Nemania sp. NC0429]
MGRMGRQRYLFLLLSLLLSLSISGQDWNGHDCFYDTWRTTEFRITSRRPIRVFYCHSFFYSFYHIWSPFYRIFILFWLISLSLHMTYESM